ncbi:MAG: response regulator [Chitinophagales bacterium]
MTSILIIDDEIQIRRLLEITLESEGYEVLVAASASQGLFAAARKQPELIVLDLGLPDENGQETLQKIREWSCIPIIILSVQSDEEEIIRALDNGANDYMVKPFRSGEFLARVRSILRTSSSEKGKPVIQFSQLEIDLALRTVRVREKMIKLTATQFDLLSLFSKNEGRVLTYNYILKEIWGPDASDQIQGLRVFIAQLRKKIEKDANKPELILTESGVGYRFVA